VGNTDAGQSGFRACDEVGRGMMVGKDARAAEEAGEHDVAPGGFVGARRLEVGGNDAEEVAQLKNVPALATEDFQMGAWRGKGITFAGYRFDKGGLTAAVGAEDADVFAGVDAQAYVVKGSGRRCGRVEVAAEHGHVTKVEQRGHGG